MTINLAVFGDSVSKYIPSSYTPVKTDLYGYKVFDYIRDNYNPLNYVNKAVSGYTTQNVVDRPEIILNVPCDIAIVAYGLNDCTAITGSAYKANLRTIIDRLRARNQGVKIILCTPSGASPISKTATATAVPAFRVACEEIATEKKCYLCKFHEAVSEANIDSLTDDGLHPGPDGHVVLFNQLKPIIDEIF